MIDDSPHEIHKLRIQEKLGHIFILRAFYKIIIFFDYTNFCTSNACSKKMLNYSKTSAPSPRSIYLTNASSAQKSQALSRRRTCLSQIVLGLKNLMTEQLSIAFVCFITN